MEENTSIAIRTFVTEESIQSKYQKEKDGTWRIEISDPNGRFSLTRGIRPYQLTAPRSSRLRHAWTQAAVEEGTTIVGLHLI